MKASPGILVQEIALSHPADGSSKARAVQALVIGCPSFSRVVVYSHGFPACRREAMLARASATELGITIVALDRPGFAQSQYYQARTLEDWAQDVRLVTDHLKIEQFYILGVSGGVPVAVAAAALLSERV